MLFKELKALLNQLKQEITCPSCNEHYDEAGIIIIGTIKDESHLHLICQNCGAHALVNAVINRDNKDRKHKGLKVRNLDKNNLKSITSDDVIDIHNFLEDFEGTFEELFSKNEK